MSEESIERAIRVVRGLDPDGGMYYRDAKAIVEAVIDAIEPRTVSTVEELSSLPSGTYVKSSSERHDSDYWVLDRWIGRCVSAGAYQGPISEVALPATVLWEPK